MRAHEPYCVHFKNHRLLAHLITKKVGNDRFSTGDRSHYYNFSFEHDGILIVSDEIKSNAVTLQNQKQ